MYTLDRGDEPYFAIVVSWPTVRSLAHCSSISSGPFCLISHSLAGSFTEDRGFIIGPFESGIDLSRL